MFYLLFNKVVLIMLLFLNVHFYGLSKAEAVELDTTLDHKVCLPCNLTLPSCNKYTEEIGEAEYRTALLMPARYQNDEIPCRYRRSINSARESGHPPGMRVNTKIMRLNRIIDESRHRENNMDEEESNPVPLKLKDLNRLSLSRVRNKESAKKSKFKGQVEYKIKDIVSETLSPDINIDAIKEKVTNLNEESIEPLISEKETSNMSEKNEEIAKESQEIAKENQEIVKEKLKRLKKNENYNKKLKTEVKNKDRKTKANVRKLIKLEKKKSSKMNSKDRKLSRLFGKHKCKHKLKSTMHAKDTKADVHMNDMFERTDLEATKGIEQVLDNRKDTRHYKDKRKLKSALDVMNRRNMADLKDEGSKLKSSRIIDASNTNEMVAMENDVEKTDSGNNADEQVQDTKQYLDHTGDNIERDILTNEMDKTDRVDSETHTYENDMYENPEQLIVNEEKIVLNDRLNELRNDVKCKEFEQPNLQEDFAYQEEKPLDDVNNDISNDENVNTNAEEEISDYNELDGSNNRESDKEYDGFDFQNDEEVVSETIDQKNDKGIENLGVQCGNSDETALADTESVHTGEKTLKSLNIINSLVRKIKPYNCDCSKQLTTKCTTPCCTKRKTTCTPSTTKCTTSRTTKCTTPCTTKPTTPCTTKCTTPCTTKPTTPCTTKCTTPCTTKPTTPCTTKCTTPCTTKPTTSCTTKCTTSRTTKCTTPCTTKCTTPRTTKCTTPCTTKCTTPRTTKCTTPCTTKRKTTCPTKCTTPCTTKRKTPCTTKCTTTKCTTPCKPKSTTPCTTKCTTSKCTTPCKTQRTTSCTTKCTTEKTPCTTKLTTTTCETNPSTTSYATKPSTTSYVTKPSTSATTPCPPKRSTSSCTPADDDSGPSSSTSSKAATTCQPTFPTTFQSFYEHKDRSICPRSNDAELKDEADRDLEKKKDNEWKTGSQEVGHTLERILGGDKVDTAVTKSAHEEVVNVKKSVENITLTSGAVSIPETKSEKPARFQETSMWALSREMQAINKRLERIIKIIRGQKKSQDKNGYGINNSEINREVKDFSKEVASEDSTKRKLDGTNKQLDTNGSKKVINQDNKERLQETNETRRGTIGGDFKISLATLAAKINHQNLWEHKKGLKHIKKDVRKVVVERENEGKDVTAAESDKEVDATYPEENEAAPANEVEYEQVNEADPLEKTGSVSDKETEMNNEEQCEKVDEVNLFTNTEDENILDQVNQLTRSKNNEELEEEYDEVNTLSRSRNKD
ncbi:hypothetical protein WDU94_002987 [Cyamophila willieti]